MLYLYDAFYFIPDTPLTSLYAARILLDCPAEYAYENVCGLERVNTFADEDSFYKKKALYIPPQYYELTDKYIPDIALNFGLCEDNIKRVYFRRAGG